MIFFAAAVVLFFGVFDKASAESNQPVINEIYPNPVDGESEWLEIYNPSGIGLDPANYDLLKSTSATPKKLDAICVTLDSYYYVCTVNNWLPNGGASLFLRYQGIIIDEIAYGSFDNLKGKSLARIPNGFDTNNDALDFRVLKPSKGLENILPVYSDKIKINEIVPQPANGSENEFIELFNTGDEEMSLAGWQLDDIDGGSGPYFFPDEQIIAAKSLLVLYQWQTNIALNDTGDSARLVDPNGDVKDEISYEKTVRGQAYAKFGDGWKWTLSLTPQAMNILTVETDAEEEIVLPMAINEAKKMADGETVRASGRVSIQSGVLSSQIIYIQDESGGIQVYCYSKCFPSLASGQLIEITGEMSSYFGERRIKILSAGDIITRDTAIIKMLPEVKSIQEICDDDVGTLVETEGVVSQTSGDNFEITNAVAINVIIRDSTGIKKPRMSKGQKARVTGVVSSYKNTLRILPFEQSGVTILTSGKLPMTGMDLNNTNMEYISNSVEDTSKTIKLLAASLTGGDVLALSGDLGSGKTTSTKFLAEYFGIKEEITSPTFVIMKNYILPQACQGIKEIVHVDAYRLHGVPDAESIGLSEYFKRKDVLVVIEWPENIANIIPPDSKQISFEYLADNRRKIKCNFS